MVNYSLPRPSPKKAYTAKSMGRYQPKFIQESLINEIKIMRGISDQNLLKLYGTFESANSLYMICELMEGHELNEQLQNHHFSDT
jgi:calcium/calmodulin-dependent protein kinase I